MSASIQDVRNRIKSFVSDDVYFYTILIIMVSVLSFGLGRLSMSQEQEVQSPQIVLKEQSAAIANTATSQSTTTKTALIKNFVASKKGSKYHLPTCPGAQQMSDANKIYFSTEAEAQAAGYTRAKNCKF